MTSWMQNEELFSQLLRKGKEAEYKVAKQLRDAGLTVQTTEMVLRKSVNEIAKFEQDQDLVVGKQGIFTLEVKSKNVRFTSIKDFRFPDIIVCEKFGFDKLTNKPFGVVIISQHTDCCIFVPTLGFRFWEEREVYDSVRQIKVRSYFCPKKYCYSFEDLIKALKFRIPKGMR